MSAATIKATVKRRTRVLRDVLFVAEGGETLIEFNEGLVYAIDAAYKNGTALTGGGTDYTWSLHRTNATLATAAAANDHFIFRLLTRMSDEDIEDFIDESTEFILSRLRTVYTDTALATYPAVEALIAARTVGYIKEELQEGAAMVNPKYRSGRELIEETAALVTALVNGSARLADDDGDLISPAVGSLVGGVKDAGGIVTSRIQMVDRAQRWTGLLMDYWPETDPDDIVDVRLL